MNSVLLPFIFLASTSIFMCLKTALAFSKPRDLEKEIHRGKIKYFFFRWISPFFSDYQYVSEFLSLGRLIALVGYGVCSTLYLLSSGFLISHVKLDTSGLFVPFYWFLLSALIFIAIALVLFALMRLLAIKASKFSLNLFGFVGSCLLLFSFVLTYPIIAMCKKLSIDDNDVEEDGAQELKAHLLELLEDDSITKRLDEHDLKLLTSLAQFGDLSAREVMIPRVDIESIKDSSTLYEALDIFVKEGYSRLPVFKESIDHISGVLLYKDVVEYNFKQGADSHKKLHETLITELVTPILFAPENKKIQDLFNEMRSKKTHAAIIVNEYGCTEGLVTIEDIIEELIGSEIMDEHDVEGDLPFKKTTDRVWIVDAKMSIIDAEREFDIEIPHSAEFETIGGFISTILGLIPAPGTVIHQDNYLLKVLSSDEKQVLKVKVEKS